MSNKEILERAIAKAIKNGWKEPDGNRLAVDDNGSICCFINGATDGIRAYGYQFNLERLIYSHEFAKALWGSEIEDPTDWANDQLEMWEYHLQQMVISPDPIKYLGEHLEESK